MNRLRAPVAAGIDLPGTSDTADAVGVDREAGIIRGASAMQAVEALGHGCVIDATTLAQVIALGNAAEGGVKVRYTHPGICGDGLGSYLGRMRDFRMKGDKVVGDIHLSRSAAASPEGNLRDYVLTLAAEDPGAFGMSVVVEGPRVWVAADGAEYAADQGKPTSIVAALPTLRVTALCAVDVVDEPAANRDGMFGRGAALLALARGTNLDAAEAFASLDHIRDQLGWAPDQVQGLLGRYLAARVVPAAPIAAARVRDLGKAHPAHLELILDASADGLSEAAIVERIAQGQATALAGKAEALLAKHAADAAAHLAQVGALTAAHAAELAQLRDQLAKAKTLAGIATSAPPDAGPGNAEADRGDLPSFTKGQASAGSIPSDILLSGKFRITP